MDFSVYEGVVRQGFETNSSSSHSLVLAPCNPELQGRKVSPVEFGYTDSFGNLYVSGETSFNWRWELWTTAGDKVNYIWLDQPDHRERLLALLKERLGVKAVVFCATALGANPALWQADEDPIGPDWSQKDWDDRCGWMGWGGIDHQSQGTASAVVRRDDDGLWDFLINPESLFRGGNDNEYGPWDYDAGEEG